MHSEERGKVRWVLLVAAMVVWGCPDRPAITPRDSLVDPIRAGMVIDLAVIGGPHAGRYHVETLQGSCSRQTFGRASWAIRYAKEGASPSGLSFTIADATAAEQGTGEVALRLTFGAHLRRGTGTATVRPEGVAAVVSVDGRAEDGVRISATIRCNEVLHGPGMDGG